MSGESDWLRTAFQDSQAANVDEPCPAPEALWALTRGELDASSARPIVLHSSRCARCGSALRIAIEMGQQVSPAMATNVVPFRRFRLGVSIGLAAAIAATVIIVPQLRPADSGIHERGGAPEGIRSLVPSTPRSRSGLVLEWSPYPAAVRYQVSLAAPDLRVVFQKTGVSGTRVEVPEAALASVPRGGRLVWNVEATLPDGRTVQSPAFDLVLE
jgi:hypothetical protein